MAFLAAAGKQAAKHTAKALEARTRERENLAYAANKPETSDAVARIEEARTRRSRNRLIAGAAAIAVAGAATLGVAYKVDRGVRDFIHGLQASVPKPQIAVQIQDVLEKVSLPDKHIYVEGYGTASVKLDSKKESSAPVVGWLWNNTLAHDTDVTAYAVREGNAQLVLTPGTIALKGSQDRSKHTPNWQVEADVNVDGLSLQLADMHYKRDKHGLPMAHSDADFLMRFGSASAAGDAMGAVTTWADNSFSNECGKVLLPDFTAGVQKFVHSELNATADLEASMGHNSESSLLRRLGTQPVKVMFYRDVELSHHEFMRQTVEPADISLAQLAIPKTTKSVEVETGSGCLVAPQAMNNQLDIQKSMLEGER